MLEYLLHSLTGAHVIRQICLSELFIADQINPADFLKPRPYGIAARRSGLKRSPAQEQSAGRRQLAQVC